MEFNFVSKGKQFSSAKTVSRSREKSAFNQAILDLNLQVGEFAYVSHKAWLDSLGDRAKTMSAGSINNGPRYSLKALGLKAQAVLLSGEELARVAKKEGNELTETSVIYEITKPEPVK